MPRLCMQDGTQEALTHMFKVSPAQGDNWHVFEYLLSFKYIIS